jgi:hypothetical protein
MFDNHKKEFQMKTIVKLLIVTVLMLATFSQGTSASAGGGGGGNFRFKGLGASAYLSSSDASGCIYTDVSIFANEQMILNTPGVHNAFSGVSLYISQYDYCTGTQLLAADGYTSLAGPDLAVSKKLESAVLNATVNMYDYVSGNSFDIWVNLNWTGVSSMGHRSNQSQYKFERCHQKYQDSSAFRFAQVSGSISDGITEFADGPAVYADIFSSKGGSVSTGCI